MLRQAGEYVVESSNTTDNIVNLIKQQEKDLGLVNVPKKFSLQKLGIKTNTDTSIKINGRIFNVTKDSPLEFAVNLIDITEIVVQKPGIKLIIRYAY